MAQRKVTAVRESHQEATNRMVRDHRTWPHLVLPLKRYKGRHELEVACLAYSEKEGYLLFKGANMFQADSFVDFDRVTPEDVLAAGWMVD